MNSKTRDEMIREAKTKNSTLKRRLNGGDMNYYVTYTGLELCKINKLLIDVLETLIPTADPDQRSGTNVDKEIPEDSL